MKKSVYCFINFYTSAKPCFPTSVTHALTMTLCVDLLTPVHKSSYTYFFFRCRKIILSIFLSVKIVQNGILWLEYLFLHSEYSCSSWFLPRIFLHWFPKVRFQYQGLIIFQCNTPWLQFEGLWIVKMWSMLKSVPVFWDPTCKICTLVVWSECVAFTTFAHTGYRFNLAYFFHRNLDRVRLGSFRGWDVPCQPRAASQLTRHFVAPLGRTGREISAEETRFF